MTACTNKARGAVVAALAGVLALGAVPAVALATGTADAQVDLLISDKATAFSKGTVGLHNTTDVTAGAAAGEYVATAKGSALKFLPNVVYLSDSSTVNINTDDYELVFYKADKDWNRTGSELAEVVEPGNYVIVVRAVDGEYAGGEAEAKLTVSAKSFSDCTGFSVYEVNPDDAEDVSDTTLIYTGSALDLGVTATDEDGNALVEGKDFEVKFLLNGSSATDPEVDVVDAKDEKNATIDYVAYLTGINEYAGQIKEVHFDVDPFMLNDVDVTIEVSDVIGDGSKPTEPTRVIMKDGTELDASLVQLTHNGVWGVNEGYSFTASAKKGYGYNITGTDTVTVNKVANEATFEYDGEALGDSLAFDKTNDECFDFDDLKVYAGEKELKFANGDYTITVRNSKGATVSNNEVEQFGGVYEVTVTVDPSKTGYEYGGSRTFTVRSTYGTIDADANITAYYDGEVVTSVEKWYDGKAVSLDPTTGNLNVTVEDANGDITGSDNYTVTVVDADGKDVTAQAFSSTGLVDAGTYTLKVESEKFDFTGTTELPIVIHKADLTSVDLGALDDYKSSEYLPINNNAISNIGATLEPKYNTHVKDADGNDTWSLINGVFNGSAWTTDTVSIEKWDAEKGEWVKDSATYCDEAGKYRFVIKGDEDLAKNFEYANGDYTTTYEFVVVSDANKADWFEDVLPTDWFFNCVNWMAGKNYIKGYADANVFDPNNTINRADVAVILYRMASNNPQYPGGSSNVDEGLGYDETQGWKTGFSDIDEGGLGNMYFAKAIAWANKVGVVNGYDDGTFGPYDAITREQLATMLANYAKVVDRATVELDEDALATMPDAGSVSSWAEKAVSWAVAEGLMGNGGSINPTSNITRAETAAMAYNYLK